MATFGKVVAQFATFVVDAADADETPDFSPLKGRVTFTPNTDRIIDNGPTDAVIMGSSPISAVLDDQGYLSTPAAGSQPIRRGIWLPATDNTQMNPTRFQYNVVYDLYSFDDRPISIPSHIIDMPAGATLNLARVVPPASAPSIGTSAAEAAAAIALDALLKAVRTINGVTPDSAGNINVTAGGTTPGTGSATPTLPVVGKSKGSQLNLYAYGHSFVAGTALTDPQYWTRLYAGSEGLTHPTSDGGTANDLMRAVGGSTASDIIARIANEVPFIAGTKGMVALQMFMNSLRVAGNNTLHVTSGRNALRAALSFLSAERRIEESDASIIYTGATVTANAIAPFSGAVGKGMTAVGGYIDIPTPAGKDAYIHTAAKGTGVAGATFTITDVANGNAILATLDMSEQSIQATGAYAWRVPTEHRGKTLRMTRTGGSTMYFDVMTVIGRTAPLILLMKEPYLANYAASTAFPNGSIAATDAFNAIIDEVALEFPNVIVADPNQAGYWDKTLHIGADQVHPNAEGHKVLGRAAYDATEAYLLRRYASDSGINRVEFDTAINARPTWDQAGVELAKKAALVHTHDAADIGSGVIAPDRLGLTATNQMPVRNAAGVTVPINMSSAVTPSSVVYRTATATVAAATAVATTDAVPLAQMNTALGLKADATALATKADLVSGVIPTSQIPALALSNVVTVASQSAMLALTSTQVQPGDIAIRTDESKTYILTAATPGTLSSWTPLLTPSGGSGAITSVNGQTGVVVLGKADIGLSNVDNTSDLNKPVSSAMTTELNKKVDTTTLTTYQGQVSTSLGARALISETYSRDYLDNQFTALNNQGQVDALSAKIDTKASVVSVAAGTTVAPPLTPPNTILFVRKA